MRRMTKVVFLIFILFSCAPLLQLEAVTSPPMGDLDSEPEVLISMDFKDANLKDILKVLSMQSGMNFIATAAVQKREMTLYLEKVPIEKAMDRIFKANNLSFEFDKDANIFTVKEWGDVGPELVTRVFYLKHASVTSSSLKEEMKGLMPGSATTTTSAGGAGGGSSGGGGSSPKWKMEESAGITEIVKKLLSKEGSIVEDYRTNSLVVTDVPSRIQTIAQVIASLDVSIPQVLIEVEMLDVKKDAVDNLGIKWPQKLMSLDVTGQRTTSFPFAGNKADNNHWTNTEGVTSPSGNWDFKDFSTSHFLPSVFTVIGANLALEALSTRSDTKFLARPKILTLNNETAEIKISTNEAIGPGSTTRTEQGLVIGQSVERAATGIILRVTPQVNLETGEITMFVVPIVIEATTGGTFNGTTVKDPEVRSTKSMVRVKDGETIVLGGLLRNKTSQTDTKVPILSNIPLLGALFRHKAKPGDQDRELLVFITPHILKDSASPKAGIALTQAKKITVSNREQSAIAGVNRRTAISGYLNNFEQ